MFCNLMSIAPVVAVSASKLVSTPTQLSLVITSPVQTSPTSVQMHIPVHSSPLQTNKATTHHQLLYSTLSLSLLSSQIGAARLISQLYPLNAQPCPPGW